MLDAPSTPVDPTRVTVDAMTVPGDLDLSFEGWTPEVFAMLRRLRETPHIEQYNAEKPGVTNHLKAPFKRYRDDLVVNWVLPNRLELETEKYVFSRLLKNDFGAGGCHDNLWMSFYRPHTKRLKDVQVSHCISPDGFDVGIYVGSYATDLLEQAQSRIESTPQTYLDLLNPLLQRKSWRFSTHQGSGDRAERPTWREPLDAVPDAVARADGIWVRRRFSREDTLNAGPDLVRLGLDTVFDVWPIYRFYLAEA